MTDAANPIETGLPDLWEHQKRAVRFAMRTIKARGGALLAIGMGGGKTRCALELSAKLPENQRTVLVLCPRSVVKVWESQAEKFLPLMSREFAVCSKTSGESGKAYAEKLSRSLRRTSGEILLCVVNYETARAGAVAEKILKTKWGMIVADESHRAKNPKTKTSKFLADIAKTTPRRLALSGTPMPERHIDIYGTARFVDRTLFGEWRDFWGRYVLPLPPGSPQVPRSWIYGKQGGAFLRCVPQNEKQLAEHLKEIAFFADPEDFMDMPSSEDLPRWSDLGKEARKAYNEMRIFHKTVFSDSEKTEEVWESEAANPGLAYLRCRQIISGLLPVEGPDGRTRSKIVLPGKKEALKDTMEALPAEEPLVVFGRFHADLDIIAQAAKETGRTSLELSGRRDQTEQWNAGEAPVLAVQTAAGSEGIDLTRARYACWYTMPDSLAQWEQARARLVRPGQKHDVRFVVLLAENTIDPLVMRRLKEKKKLTDAIKEEASNGY